MLKYISTGLIYYLKPSYFPTMQCNICILNRQIQVLTCNAIIKIVDYSENPFYLLTFIFYSLYNLLCWNLSFGKLSVGTSVFENDASGLVAKFCEKKTQPESIGHQLCSTEIFLQSSLTIPRGLRPRWSTSVQSVGCWLLDHVIYLKLRRK